MAYEFKLTRHVDFAETDMAGIMHFSNFFRFMEAAETAFFRSLGLSIYPRSPDTVGWPRVHADCDFKHPLRFEDLVEIHLLVREKGKKSLAYTFIFRKLNETPIREVARGSVVTACVTRDKVTGKMLAVPIPQSIAELIEAAPSSLLA
ncbi:MAG: acyl-CoA thioesterase [Acidobacteria bacterium]|nr:acyl-CoA thioesterase [Acidobacteriota bacterium]MCI0719468.1 acyl-CoA thioesterase [Acidobacteriota bacterium]